MPNLDNLIWTLQGAVSVDDVVNLLASCLIIAVPFILGWMGVRKVWGVFTSAVTRGRARVR